MRNLLIAVTATVFAAYAHAQETRGGYLGFAVGSIDYEETTFGLKFDDDASSYRVLGGYSFSDHFALEAGWGVSSDLSETFGSTVITADYRVLTTRALGTLPLGKASLLGGIGYYRGELTSQDLSAVLPSRQKRHDSGATVVGGVQFTIARAVIRTELEWFDMADNINTSTGSVGVLFRF